MVTELEKNGFVRLDEKESWENVKGGNYYFTRNQSTIVAFSKPTSWKQGNGFTIQAAHTDSCVYKVKPKSKQSTQGYLQVGVEAYGGGLWNTWFDRDLSVAGRLLIRDTKTKGAAKSVLVRINRPILRISNLAIHLNREVRQGFKFNTENETVPMFATEAALQLTGNGKDKKDKKENKDNTSDFEKDHHALLLELLAKEASCEVSDIIDFELSLYDTHDACVGGALDEFIFSARLDNLGSCFTCMRALIDSLDGKYGTNKKAPRNGNIRIFAAFDNEEVGSSSNRGAASNLLFTTMQRLHTKPDNKGLFESSIQKSILVSCDMAHAVHPNYVSKHESQHRPKMHDGLVLKYNSNQRYATNMVSTYHIIELANKLGIKLQKFVVRNDMPCGSTIGPILSTRCGIRTVDCGCPQLSMHSIREVCGVKDICTSTQLFTQYYNEFEKLDEKLNID